MQTKRTKRDFIAFIIDSGRSTRLVDEFMSQKTAEDLHSFFKKKKYKDIRASDCEDILNARGKMLGRHIPKKGQTAKGSCVPSGHAY